MKELFEITSDVEERNLAKSLKFIHPIAYGRPAVKPKKSGIVAQMVVDLAGLVDDAMLRENPAVGVRW
jgi:hypothetical protein